MEFWMVDKINLLYRELQLRWCVNEGRLDLFREVILKPRRDGVVVQLRLQGQILDEYPIRNERFEDDPFVLRLLGELWEWDYGSYHHKIVPGQRGLYLVLTDKDDGRKYLYHWDRPPTLITPNRRWQEVGF